MVRNILIFIVSIVAIPVMSQTSLTFPSSNAPVDSTTVIRYLASDVNGQGHIRFNHEVSIDSLIELAKDVLSQNGSMGYTVQLFRGSNGQVSRRNAENIKSQYLKKNSEGEIKVVYTNPNWRVHVGNFRTYAQAMKEKVYLEKVMSEYKDQIYIVRVALDFTDNTSQNQ